jgi:methylglutaconyl-CoA hydratase
MTSLLIDRAPSGVTTLTLNRPDVHNAFDDEVIDRLTDALGRSSADQGTRVVVLRANGKSFSAGADLGWMQRMAGYSFEENVADASALGLMLKTLDGCSKPTVAVVQGAALGGGVGLVAACDIGVAADSAVFGLTEVRLGLIPAVISPYVIAAIGERTCRRYFLTGERFPAEVARTLGLVHEVAPSDQLDAVVRSVLDDLLQGGPAAQAGAKDLIRAVARRPTDDALRHDTAVRIARQRASPEGREGVGAFLAKRKPAWTR